MNNQTLKQLLKEPLENKKEFKEFQERTYQFLLGVYNAGKAVQQSQTLKLIIAALNEFASGLGKEGNVSWGDYYTTEEDIRTWLESRLTEPVDEQN